MAFDYLTGALKTVAKELFARITAAGPGSLIHENARKEQVLNLFNPLGVIENSLINGETGQIFVAEGYFVTGKIAVSPGQKVYISGAETYSAAFFGFDQQFIAGASGAPLVSVGGFITVPNECFYIESAYSDAVKSTLMFTEGFLPSGYVPFGLGTTNNLIRAEVNLAKRESSTLDAQVNIQLPLMLARALAKAAPLSINRFDASSISADTALNGAAGLTYASTGNFVSDMIYVTAGETIYTSHPIYNYSFFDLEETLVSGETLNPPIPAGGSIAVPLNAFGLKLGFQMELASELVISPKPISGIYSGFGRDFNRWDGKSIGFVGDSFSSDGFYQPAVVTALSAKWINFTGSGVSGRKMGELVSVLTEANLSGLDLLTIWLGTNDFFAGTPLGTRADAASANTFYGHIKRNIDTALTIKPSLRLALITPTKRIMAPAWNVANSDGRVMVDYVRAIVEVAEDYSVPVLNLFARSGVNSYTLSTWSNDDLHLYENIHKTVIAPQIATFIKEI